MERKKKTREYRFVVPLARLIYFRFTYEWLFFHSHLLPCISIVAEVVGANFSLMRKTKFLFCHSPCDAVTASMSHTTAKQQPIRSRKKMLKTGRMKKKKTELNILRTAHG